MQRFDMDSEVYKMILENRESRNPPRQSNTFKMLQEVLEADEKGKKHSSEQRLLHKNVHVCLCRVSWLTVQCFINLECVYLKHMTR